MTGRTRAAQLALLLLLGLCDACGRTTPSAPAGSGTATAASSSHAPAASSPASPSAKPNEVIAEKQPGVIQVAPRADEIHVPATQIYEPRDLAAGERRPLLIFLHGLGASGKIAFDVLHLAAFGARERVFVVAPDGSADHLKRQFWNAGTACCNFDRREVDDVARLTALLDAWRSRPDVDPTRVYVVGHSNGGFMTERLACSIGARISAAASLSGAAPPAELACQTGQSLHLLEVHGDADEIVRYAGGSVFDSAELAPFPAAEQGFHDWAKRLGCAGRPALAPALDLDAKLPGAETNVEQYRGCALGSVTLWTVHGGNHYVGTGQQAFEAIWRFLSAHHS